MAMPRYAARRDANESELVVLAHSLGWRLWKLHEPADWLALRRGQWHVVEIKNPGGHRREGAADEYSHDQRKFRAEVFACGGRLLTWRTKDDLFRDSNARASA
jgi:hypothetical protein